MHVMEVFQDGTSSVFSSSYFGLNQKQFSLAFLEWRNYDDLISLSDLWNWHTNNTENLISRRISPCEICFAQPSCALNNIHKFAFTEQKLFPMPLGILCNLNLSSNGTSFTCLIFRNSAI